jgi:hypothetical protein
VPVTADVDRVVVWPTLDCAGDPRVHGSPRPEAPPEPQDPPKKGVGARVDAAKAAAQLGRLPHVLASWREADGFPTVASTRVAEAAAGGIRLSSGHPLPPGGRRAGVLGHDYKAQLAGPVSRQYTGWLEDGVYAPHTYSGFRAPGNKTLVLLANGLMAKSGLRKARGRRAA